MDAEIQSKIHVISEKTNLLSLVNEVIETQKPEDAFIICDIGEIIQQYEIWMQELPRVKPHYAVKCNNNAYVLKTIATLGLGFDCASKNEINQIISMGIHPDKIVYAHTTKQMSHIEYAKKVGVTRMTFDNEPELFKIHKFHPKSELILRFRCDDPASEFNLGLKFGCDPILDPPNLLKTAKDLNLNVIGVSFHIGSNSKTPELFYTAIRFARQIFETAKSIGYNFTLLDIGGGFPGIRGSCFKEYTTHINSGLEEFFPDPNVTVIAEPGRYFVASSCISAANIHSMKSVEEKNGVVVKRNSYYINDGHYGSFSIMKVDLINLVEPLKEHKNAKLIKSTIWGPACNSVDIVIDDVLLPQMNIGDWIIFHDMGGYCMAAATNFNGFEPPKMYMVAKKSTWETLKDTKYFDQNVFTHEDILLAKPRI